MKTLALACEDNASDVLLPDTEVVYLGSQVRPHEDADVDQVGEAGQTGLCLVLTGHWHTWAQNSPMGRQFVLGLVAHLGQCEHLQLPLRCIELGVATLLVRCLRQVPRDLAGFRQQVLSTCNSPRATTGVWCISHPSLPSTASPPAAPCLPHLLSMGEQWSLLVPWWVHGGPLLKECASEVEAATMPEREMLAEWSKMRCTGFIPRSWGQACSSINSGGGEKL